MGNLFHDEMIISTNDPHIKTLNTNVMKLNNMILHMKTIHVPKPPKNH